MALFNQQKFSLAWRVALSEAKILVPIFFVFQLLTYAVMAFTPASTPADPVHTLAVLPLRLALLFPPYLFYLAKMAILRQRSLQHRLSFETVVDILKRGTLPALRVVWTFFWILVGGGFVMGLIYGVLYGIIRAGDPHLAADAAASAYFVLVPAILALLIWMMPYSFAILFRLFHPTLAYKDVLAMSKRQVSGRRTEIIVTGLITLIPFCLLIVVSLIMGMDAVTTSPVVRLLMIPFQVFFALPGFLLSYLYYEEFETTEGLHPTTHATPPADVPA